MTKIVKLKGKNFLGVKANREEVVLPVGVREINSVKVEVDEKGTAEITKVLGNTDYTFSKSVEALTIDKIENSSEISTIIFTANSATSSLTLSADIKIDSAVQSQFEGGTTTLGKDTTYFILIKNGIILSMQKIVEVD